jgi:hypothetical protein
MVTSSGGPVPPQLASGETLWRLIFHSWFRPDANGVYTVQEVAFIGNVSLIRGDYLTTNDVDLYVDKNGINIFVKVGIAVLKADEIIRRTGATLNVTSNSFGWPLNTHVELIRSTSGKNLKASHPEVSDLTDIANGSQLLRNPKP